MGNILISSFPTNHVLYITIRANQTHILKQQNYFHISKLIQYLNSLSTVHQSTKPYPKSVEVYNIKPSAPDSTKHKHFIHTDTKNKITFLLKQIRLANQQQITKLSYFLH